MVAVGFSAGTETGFWAIAIYFIVQNVDGYLIMPYVARKTVDLAPALVLAAQLIFGALFGILGLFLADPIIATIKVSRWPPISLASAAHSASQAKTLRAACAGMHSAADSQMNQDRMAGVSLPLTPRTGGRRVRRG